MHAFVFCVHSLWYTDSMDKLSQATPQITIRAMKGPAKFLSVPGQCDWADQNHFSPAQQVIVTLTVPLFSVPVTYTWPTNDKAVKEVDAAILAEISLQFRPDAVRKVSLFTCCNGHSSLLNIPHSSMVILNSLGLPLQKVFWRVVESMPDFPKTKVAMSGWFAWWLLPPFSPRGVCITTWGAASPERINILPELSAKMSCSNMQAQCSLLNTGAKDSMSWASSDTHK